MSLTCRAPSSDHFHCLSWSCGPHSNASFEITSNFPCLPSLVLWGHLGTVLPEESITLQRRLCFLGNSDGDLHFVFLASQHFLVFWIPTAQDPLVTVTWRILSETLRSVMQRLRLAKRSQWGALVLMLLPDGHLGPYLLLNWKLIYFIDTWFRNLNRKVKQKFPLNFISVSQIHFPKKNFYFIFFFFCILYWVVLCTYLFGIHLLFPNYYYYYY